MSSLAAVFPNAPIGIPNVRADRFGVTAAALAALAALIDSEIAFRVEFG